MTMGFKWGKELGRLLLLLAVEEAQLLSETAPFGLQSCSTVAVPQLKSAVFAGEFWFAFSSILLVFMSMLPYVFF